MGTGDSGYACSAYFYDHIPIYSGRDDIPFYSQIARDCGGPVLELGCGTGRVLLELAGLGISVTGLDSSEEMLEICRRKLSSSPDEVSSLVTLMEGDMRDFSLDSTYPLVIVPFRAFQHLLTVEEQLDCLHCVRRHIHREGTFILDLFNPSMEYILDGSRRSEFGEEPPFSLPDGSTVTRRMRNPEVDLAGQVISCEIIYYVLHPDGSQERAVHEFDMRYLFRYEAEHLLERSGFSVTDVYGDFRYGAFGADWPGELILRAVPKLDREEHR